MPQRGSPSSTTTWRPETDGDVVDLVHTWLERALRSQAGFRGLAVVRSEPAAVVLRGPLAIAKRW